MTESERSPARMLDEQKAVLRTLRDLLETIGNANDAEDHGYGEDAEQMRKDSYKAIRDLMVEHAFLAEIFPKLQWELDTKHIQAFGWAELCDSVDAHLDVLIKGHENG